MFGNAWDCDLSNKAVCCDLSRKSRFSLQMVKGFRIYNGAVIVCFQVTVCKKKKKRVMVGCTTRMWFFKFLNKCLLYL